MHFTGLFLFIVLTVSPRFLLFALVTLASIPPAAKALAISITVYGILQGLKQAPWFSDLLKGWWAVAFNVVFSALGVVVVTPADQLYTSNTLVLLVSTAAAAAGIHGTVSNLSNQAQDKKDAQAAAIQDQLVQQKKDLVSKPSDISKG